MRTHGKINEVWFERQGFKMSHLAIEYKISKNNENKLVYVNNMRELKNEIQDFTRNFNHG